MTIRIVVANEREASFLDADDLHSPLHLVDRIEDPNARLRDRDLETDRPGRAFDRMSPHRHAMGGERSTRRTQQSGFARRIADAIDHGRTRHDFDRLVLMAGPRMLGLIREALPAANRPLIVAEISKNLAHDGAEEIQDYSPREALRKYVTTRH